MITIDDLRAVPMFEGLAADVLTELARSAADMHLSPGEFAMHEGEQPALFAVLSGKLEVVKLVDGIERTVGFRTPGKLLGEIPVVYGTQFQSGAKAVEPSRVLRIDVRHYYAAAAAAPELAKAMGELARERLTGLQGIAAEKKRHQVILAGNRYDPECQALRRFLARNLIDFAAAPPDDLQLANLWVGPLPTSADCPILQFADGSIMRKPEPRELARRLGLQTVANHPLYDTVIVGGGPAGLAAAVYGASEGLRTLVVECEAPGGQAGTSSRIENYLGFPSGISGDELASRALRQAKRLGAEILVARRVIRIDPARHWIELDGGEIIRSRTIIIATGVSWRKLAIEGFERLIGKGVYYGAARSEADATQGMDIHLIGAGNSAGQAAMFFANHANTVTLVVRGPSIADSMSQYLVEQIRGKSNIRVLLQSEVKAAHGEIQLEAIDILDRAKGSTSCQNCSGLFVFIGADAETQWLPPEVARSNRGYVLTGVEVPRGGVWKAERDPFLLETSVPGIFACGDVRLSPVKRVASAVGEGSMAIAFVHQYIALTENAPS
jgi:thioredoxin reductase (NADPH)